MLFLAGFIPTRGASKSVMPELEGDSLPVRTGVILTTDGQKRLQIYNDPQGADSLFRLSMAQDSTYAPAYYFATQSIMNRQGSLDSVLMYAEKAYLLDSTNKWYSDTYAQALAIAGDFPMALKLFKRSIERDPQNLNAYVMVAMIYRQTSQPLSAISILDSAEVRTGKNPYVSTMKQDLLVATGQQDRAIAEAIELTELDPESIENRLMLADLYSATRQDSLAHQTLQAALAVDSTSLLLLNSMSQYYAERQSFPAYFDAVKRIFAIPSEPMEEKIATFNRITSDRAFYAKNLLPINSLATQLYLQYPDQKAVVELYTQHLIASGNLDQALEIYKDKAAKSSPPDYDYYTTVIDIESYKQRFDSVELYAARAIELFPDRHELRISQANLYSFTQRFEEAINRYQEIIKIVPTDTLKGTIWGYIGDNYHQLSLLESAGGSKAKALMRKAYKSYDQSLKLFANNPLVLNNYAYFLSLEQRELERALDMSGRAIALQENNPTYLDTYAWVLFELGRYEEAKKTMRQVIALDTTDSADIQYHYAEILAKLGEDFMAEVYYDKALKLGFDAEVIELKKSKLKH